MSALVAMGFGGDERITRLTSQERRGAVCSPPLSALASEPGMWLQFDWAEGPVYRMAGASTPVLRLGGLIPLLVIVPT